MQLVAMVIITSLMMWIFQPRFHERWVVNVFLCKTIMVVVFDVSALVLVLGTQCG